MRGHCTRRRPALCMNLRSERGVGAARGGSFSGHLSILSCWARRADSQAPLGVSVEPRHLTRMSGSSQALQLWSAGSVHPSAPGPLPASHLQGGWGQTSLVLGIVGQWRTQDLSSFSWTPGCGQDSEGG